MGEVWRAVDQALDRPVAVKLLRPEYVHDQVILPGSAPRRSYAGQLNDPGIAQVYDYDDVSPASPAYLVMELVDGPSLAGVLATGPLPPRRTADVLAQAAEALHAAHAAGVLHRDIKPGNLLIAADGRVKVTDFGIAQSSRAGQPDPYRGADRDHGLPGAGAGQRALGHRGEGPVRAGHRRLRVPDRAAAVPGRAAAGRPGPP